MEQHQIESTKRGTHVEININIEEMLLSKRDKQREETTIFPTTYVQRNTQNKWCLIVSAGSVQDCSVKDQVTFSCKEIECCVVVYSSVRGIAKSKLSR